METRFLDDVHDVILRGQCPQLGADGGLSGRNGWFGLLAALAGVSLVPASLPRSESARLNEWVRASPQLAVQFRQPSRLKPQIIEQWRRDADGSLQYRVAPIVVPTALRKPCVANSTLA